jgi:hypothetical protein
MAIAPGPNSMEDFEKEGRQAAATLHEVRP